MIIFWKYLDNVMWRNFCQRHKSEYMYICMKLIIKLTKLSMVINIIVTIIY